MQQRTWPQIPKITIYVMELKISGSVEEALAILTGMRPYIYLKAICLDANLSKRLCCLKKIAYLCNHIQRITYARNSKILRNYNKNVL